MRHGKKFNHLGRKAAHRNAMLSNMACSLIEHKRIKTTVAKAKALRVFVEPILTKSKEDSTHSRRIVFSYLQNKAVVSELFRDVAPKIAARPGGYTRILRLGSRIGDSAEMCLIELVDYNELLLTEKAEKKGAKRSRRGGKTKTTTTTAKASAEAKPAASEAAVEEVKGEVGAEAVKKTVKAETPEKKKEEPKKEEEQKPEANAENKDGANKPDEV